jgi:hypothetical protein
MKWREKSTRLLTVIDLVVKTRPSKAVRVKVILGLFARRILTTYSGDFTRRITNALASDSTRRANRRGLVTLTRTERALV